MFENFTWFMHIHLGISIKWLCLRQRCIIITTLVINLRKLLPVQYVRRRRQRFSAWFLLNCFSNGLSKHFPGSSISVLDWGNVDRGRNVDPDGIEFFVGEIAEVPLLAVFEHFIGGWEANGEKRVRNELASREEKSSEPF